MTEERNITSASKDVSIDAYREANRLDIYINKVGMQSSHIFGAYSTSKFVNASSVQFGSFSQDLLDFLNGTFGSFGKAMMQGISDNINAGNGNNQSYSSLFDAPISPYLKGLSEQTWSVDCVLFMDDEKYTSSELCFYECIVKPINTLYHVFLPSVSDNTVNDFIQDVNDHLNKYSDWLEEGHKDDWFFMGASGVVKAFMNYTKNLRQLNNPIQMHTDVSLTFILGRFVINEVLIEDITTEYGDMIMKKGGNVYPSYCKVKIKFKGKFRNRIDTVWSGNMGYNNVVDKY